MDAYNSGRRAEDRRQLYPYSWVEAEKLPSFASSPNMHIAGHICKLPPCILTGSVYDD